MDTVTISGPEDAVTEFVAQLKSEGIFAKGVKSAGVAFHSHYMANTAPSLKAALLKVGHQPHAATKLLQLVNIAANWLLKLCILLAVMPFFN